MATAQVYEEECFGFESDSSEDSDESSNQQGPRDAKLTGGQYFQWQLSDGESWKNIDNDHIIEINYSLPHSEGIKIYNTPYGMVSLDFNRMRVLNKNLLVRRLDDGRSKWIWYCMLSNTWKNYGSADARGNRSPPSEAIEKSFQANPCGSFIFSIDDKRYEINFRGMKQVGKKRRAVRRRPVYQPKQQGAGLQDCCRICQWADEGITGGWREYTQSLIRGTPVPKHEITETGPS